MNDSLSATLRLYTGKSGWLPGQSKISDSKSDLAQLKDINIDSLVYIIQICAYQMSNAEAASTHLRELGLCLPIPAMCYVNLSTRL